MPNDADSEPQALDQLTRLPFKASLSIVLVLAAAGFNAFNDNILKMMLVGLAPKVVAGSMGDNIGAWLGGMILLPYIIFAPLAGFLSDRYSKRNVILAMLVAQALVLLLAGACFNAALGRLSIILALGSFFLLAVQSTFFSPAKMGILKELAGSRRLGMVAGWLQMVTMIGILGGLWLGGNWYDWLFVRHQDPWVAAAKPIWILFALAILAFVVSFRIQRTPAHREVRFHQAVCWEHFTHLADAMRDRGLRRAALGNAVYWFVASMAGAMFIDIGLVLYPDTTAGGAAGAASTMTFMVGLGMVGGSVFVSWINRRGLQIGIVPLAALALAVALIWAGSSGAGTRSFDWALVTIGFMGGCYLVPIQAYIQDRADPVRRGRVLSAVNLLDSIAGILAVSFLVLLKRLGLTYHGHFWILGGLMLVAAIYMVRILPQDVVRFVALSIVRTLYKVRAVNAANVPKTGGVLLLPNHVSYVDAFVLGAACDRRVRFVMWDQLYNIRSVNWLLRILGTVPISATRAKDAVRNVAAALKDGGVVCVFPEGQITRHGMINELRKGFELMARQADAPVVPVHLDGLYGSIFSYKGGLCFKKWPRKLRYPVVVSFGPVLPPRQATAEAVRTQILELSRSAFLARPALAVPDAGDDAQAQAHANAQRLLDIEWACKGDVLLCLAAPGSMIARSVDCYGILDPAVTVTRDPAVAAKAARGSVIVVHSDEINGADRAAALPIPAGKIRFAACWADALSPLQQDPAAMAANPSSPPILRGLLDAASGAFVSASVPDPAMPSNERGNQRGVRPGTLGRLLPGLAVRSIHGGIAISGLRPESDSEILLPNFKLSDDGFLAPAASSAEKADAAAPEGEAAPE